MFLNTLLCAIALQLLAQYTITVNVISRKRGSMDQKLLLIAFLLILTQNGSLVFTAQTCTSGSLYSTSMVKSPGSISANNRWYLNSGFRSTCSGQVIQYIMVYFSLSGSTTYNIHFALWNPVNDGTNTTYELNKGSITYLSFTKSTKVKQISPSSLLYIRKGAVIGVYFDGLHNHLPVHGSLTGGNRCYIDSPSVSGPAMVNCGVSGNIESGQVIRVQAQINIIDCSPIPDVTNASTTLVDGDTEYGGRVMYTCDKGYELTSGNQTLQCNENATWSGTVPMCTIITCPAITIDNGAVTETDSNNYQSVVSFVCDTGYVLNGTSISIICQISGKWNNTIPICIPTSSTVPSTSSTIMTTSTTTGTSSVMATSTTISTSNIMFTSTTSTTVTGTNNVIPTSTTSSINNIIATSTTTGTSNVIAISTATGTSNVMPTSTTSSINNIIATSTTTGTSNVIAASTTISASNVTATSTATSTSNVIATTSTATSTSNVIATSTATSTSNVIATSTVTGTGNVNAASTTTSTSNVIATSTTYGTSNVIATSTTGTNNVITTSTATGTATGTKNVIAASTTTSTSNVIVTFTTGANNVITTSTATGTATGTNNVIAASTTSSTSNVMATSTATTSTSSILLASTIASSNITILSTSNDNINTKSISTQNVPVTSSGVITGTVTSTQSSPTSVVQSTALSTAAQSSVVIGDNIDDGGDSGLQVAVGLLAVALVGVVIIILVVIVLVLVVRRRRKIKKMKYNVRNEGELTTSTTGGLINGTFRDEKETDIQLCNPLYSDTDAVMSSVLGVHEHVTKFTGSMSPEYCDIDEKRQLEQTFPPPSFESVTATGINALSTSGFDMHGEMSGNTSGGPITDQQYFELEEPTVEGPAFTQEPIYWHPESSTMKIYDQLFRRKYREISREKLSITEHLGSGQYGSVEKGVWYSSKGPIEVAIKTLKGVASKEDEVKFLQEAAINGQFLHPNVVQLFGVVTVGKPILIVLEYIPNGDLKEFLEKRRPMPGEMIDNNLIHMLIQFSHQVARGMVYLSKKRFIHRDLAARNILVGNNYICKIADFGMSRDLQDESYYRSNSKQIPLKWTAPEAIHYRKYTTESDIWSFGAVLYEIWSVGYKPFQQYSNQECLDMVDDGYRLASPSWVWQISV